MTAERNRRRNQLFILFFLLYHCLLTLRGTINLDVKKKKFADLVSVLFQYHSSKESIFEGSVRTTSTERK